MTKWKKNDAALIWWGEDYVMKRVLFVTDDGKPVVKIDGQYWPGDTTWSMVGVYTRRFFWGWRGP